MCLLGNFEFYSFIWEKINSSRVDDKYMLLKRREAEWISITWEALLIWCYKFSFTDSKIIISCTSIVKNVQNLCFSKGFQNIWFRFCTLSSIKNRIDIMQVFFILSHEMRISFDVWCFIQNRQTFLWKYVFSLTYKCNHRSNFISIFF